MLYELSNSTVSFDESSLTTEQLVYMLTYHSTILTAFMQEDRDTLNAIVNAAGYKRAFGTMSIHQAFDRYERTCIDQLIACEGC
jgi:hypothetical protein